jgi:hypothetical protein
MRYSEFTEQTITPPTTSTPTITGATAALSDPKLQAAQLVAQQKAAIERKKQVDQQKKSIQDQIRQLQQQLSTLK